MSKNKQDKVLKQKMIQLMNNDLYLDVCITALQDADIYTKEKDLIFKNFMYKYLLAKLGKI